MGLLTKDKIPEWAKCIFKPENNSPISGEKIASLGLKPEKKWDI